MVNIFSKIKNGRPMFAKVYDNLKNHTKKLFDNLPTTSRMVDNTIQRIGNFAKGAADALGFDSFNPFIKGFTKASHSVRNALVKAVKTPINDIRNENLM